MHADLLDDLIREYGTYVYASPEDADYFRALHKPIAALPPKTPEPVKPVAIPQSEPAAKAPSPQEPVKLSPPQKSVVLVTTGKSEEPPVMPDPIQAPTISDLGPVRRILSIVAPELAILPEVPSDLNAQKIAERWKTKNQSAPISILTMNETPQHKKLLEAITKALDVTYGGARLVSAEGIEKAGQWEAFLSSSDLKIVIACDYTLWQLHQLMKFYKEETRTLGKIPLFLLPDLSLYLKDPALKRSLWKALCQKLS